MRHPGLKENIALWMPYILTGSYCHIYVNKLRFKNTLKVFRVNVVKKKKRSETIYTEVWVMSEMKIHPNSQTTLGLQNHWAVPGAANDIKAKVSSEKFYSNLFCTWIHNSQQCYIYRRWLRAKIRSFAVFVWPNCRKTADSLSTGAVKFQTGFILSQWWMKLGRSPTQLLLRSCERSHISQPTQHRKALWWFPVALLSLSRFRWRRRLVVISAPSDEDWAYSQQLAALSGQACNFGESKEIIFLLPKTTSFLVMWWIPLLKSDTRQSEESDNWKVCCSYSKYNWKILC